MFVGTLDDRLEHARPGEVLRRDQLDLAALALQLAADQLGDLRVDVGEAGAAEVLEGLLRRREPSARCYSRNRSGGGRGQPLERIGGRNRALAQHLRLGAGDVDHRRGRARQLAAVERGAAGLANLAPERPRGGAGPGRRAGSRSSRRPRRPGPARRAPARRQPAPGRRSSPASAPLSQRNRRAGFGSTSVYGAGQQRPGDHGRPAAQLRHALEQHRRRRRRAARTAGSRAALQPRRAARPAPRGTGRRRARRPCRSAGSPAARRGSPLPPARRRPIAPPRLGPCRSGPGSSGCSRTLASPAAPTRSSARPSPDLEHEAAAGPKHVRARRAASRRGVLVADGRDPRLPVAHLGLEPVDLARAARTAGWRRRGRSCRRARRAGRACSNATSSPVAAAFARATSSASSETSIAVTTRARMLVGDRERDRARAGADIEHRGRVEPAEQLEAALDDDLRLGPGDEDAPVDLQRQPPEAPLAEDVRDRLAAARGARAARGRRRARSAHELALAIRRRARGGSRPSAWPTSSSASSRAVSIPAARAAARPPGQQLADRHASSARRRSSAVSASVNSPSSPSRIRSSWCTVSLIRWSVSRFSGKL